MPVSELIAGLSNNPYFGAGTGLFGLGLAAAALRKGAQVAQVIFRRQCLITLEVSSRDKSYEWLLEWITCNARNSQHRSVATVFEQHETGKISTHFNFMPSVGQHFFSFRGNLIRVDRVREQATNFQTGQPFETVTLTALGRRMDLFNQILVDARSRALTKHEGKTIIYAERGHEWREFGHPRRRRPLSSVVLDAQQSDRIMTDVRNFLSSYKWYDERGVPFRRGYLLHGPPGCGKTSFITALAGELELSISILNLSDRRMDDDRLNHLMSIAPPQSIILLEDIDAAFVSREDTPKMQVAYEGLSRVTFSGLLNMLDGVASSEGRILFMTTNYLERLDPALIRPGRVDVKEYIGYATDYQLKVAFKNFFPGSPDLLTEKFVKTLRKTKKPVTMAGVQGFFLMFKDDPEQAVQKADQLLKQ